MLGDPSYKEVVLERMFHQARSSPEDMVIIIKVVMGPRGRQYMIGSMLVCVSNVNSQIGIIP